jgi:putative flippase GtrA
MGGFPRWTPDGPPVVSTLHGTLHIVAGGIGFLALIIATFVLARRFRREGRPGRAVGSIVTGVAFLTAFCGHRLWSHRARDQPGLHRSRAALVGRTPWRSH